MWPRDGEWVAYTAGEMFSPPNAEADVWKARPDGTSAVNLMPDSPGSDQLAFSSNRDGELDPKTRNRAFENDGLEHGSSGIHAGAHARRSRADDHHVIFESCRQD